MARPSAGVPGVIAPPRSVAGRLMAIMNCFTSEEPALSLAQLQERTGLSQSTVHRLARELLDWGGLERAGDGRYQVGLRLYELGMTAPRQRQLRDLALPAMEDLYIATGDTVHLGVLDGTQVLIVEKLTGLRSSHTPSTPGGRLPAHATGIGKALLAFAPRAVVEHVLAGPLPAYTGWTITDPDVLAENLARVRERGYAVAFQERSWGTVSVAAPLLDAREKAVAALSLVGGKNRMDIDAAAAAVGSVAHMLGREMAGFTGPGS